MSQNQSETQDEQLLWRMLCICRECFSDYKPHIYMAFMVFMAFFHLRLVC